MIDTMTNEPMKVETGGTPIHSLDLPYSQLEEVKKRLDASGVDYWVESRIFIWEDNPPIAYIRFHPKTDTKLVQEALDQVSADAYYLQDSCPTERLEKVQPSGVKKSV